MPGLLRGVARTAVVAGTATAVSNRVSRRQAGRWADQDQSQYAPEPQYAPPPQQYSAPPPQYAAPAPAPAPAAPAEDLYEQLAKLGDLRDKGILTEAEFEVQKARVLGR